MSRRAERFESRMSPILKIWTAVAPHAAATRAPRAELPLPAQEQQGLTAESRSAAAVSTASGGEQNVTFPDIAALAKPHARTLVVDGEVLRSRFEWLRARPCGRRHAAAVHGIRPALPRRPRPDRPPTRDRRARLEDVVASSGPVFPVRRLAPDGLLAWTKVVECGYEGLVAKDEASVYEGGPTRLSQGQAEGLDGPRGWLAAADQRGAAGSLIVPTARAHPIA